MISTFVSEMGVLWTYILTELSSIWVLCTTTILVIPIILFVIRRIFRIFDFLTS